MTRMPYLGFGLGLRAQHYDYILKHRPNVDWFEIITEDYLVEGGQALANLRAIAKQYPIVMHGVSLSIGSLDPINNEYLRQVKALAEEIKPAWISDHICWTGVHGLNTHDLLPIPYTEEALAHMVARIQHVQAYLGRPLLLENPSTYIEFHASTFSEWEFIQELTKRSNCRLLLDINNIYVSCINHGWDPITYLNAIPVDRVQQFHLAGHTNKGDYIIDTHDHPIIDEVWELYRAAVKRFGRVSTMIERDDNIPDFPELLNELNEAKTIAQQCLSQRIVA